MPPGPVNVPSAQTPAVAPTPAPVPNVSVNTNTPLHAAVRANPAITPRQMVDLHDKITPQGAPPLSIQGASIVKAQALMPLAAAAPIASSDGPFNAAQIANTRPQLAPVTAPVRPSGMIPIGAAPPAVAGANAAQFAASTAPQVTAPTSAAGVANAARLQGSQASIDASGPTAPATPATSPSVPVAALAPSTNMPTGPIAQSPLAGGAVKPAQTAPGAQPVHPSWLQNAASTLQRAAPLIAGAIIGKSNPGVGGAALAGYQQGEQQVQERQAQQAQAARETAQQTLENQRQSTQDTNAQTQQDLENQQKADEDRTAFYDSLKGLSPASQEERVKALTSDEANRIGVDPTTFYDKDGKFIPQTAGNVGGAKDFGPLKTVKDAYDWGAANGFTPENNPNMAVLASRMGNADADPTTEISPFWNKQETGNNAVNNGLKATMDETANRARFQAASQSSQQATLDKYKGAPEHFKADYGFTMPDAPIEKESDALHQQQLTETAKYHNAEEALSKGRLDQSKHSEADVNAYHKVMEGIGRQNADAHTASSAAATKRAADTANFNNWRMSKVSDPAGKSVYNNAWGPTYDKAVNSGIALSKFLQEWRDNNPGKPDPSAIVNNLIQISTQVDRMNNSKPPASFSTRSQAYANGQVAKPTDMKTIGTHTMTVAQWRQYYKANRPGLPLPF